MILLISGPKIDQILHKSLIFSHLCALVLTPQTPPPKTTTKNAVLPQRGAPHV